MEGIEGAATLAARIRSGALTAVEAVADCIVRIEAADGPMPAATPASRSARCTASP
jgi:Asp-tRNA(Asn)/Glu-tRNA(Gln) amidotransferase A subunit family amidase